MVRQLPVDISNLLHHRDLPCGVVRGPGVLEGMGVGMRQTLRDYLKDRLSFQREKEKNAHERKAYGEALSAASAVDTLEFLYSRLHSSPIMDKKI